MRALLFLLLASVLAVPTQLKARGHERAHEREREHRHEHEHEHHRFVLANKTGWTIRGVYIAPTRSESWGENILGRDRLRDGETVEIGFRHHLKAERWDIKITWADGSRPVIWNSQNLMRIRKITLHYNRKTDETTANTE